MSRRDAVLVSRTLYQLGIVTLFASLMWVGIGIYSALNEPLKGQGLDAETLKPIDPNLDKKTLESITGRAKVQPIEITLKVDESEASASAVVDDNIELGTEDELTN